LRGCRVVYRTNEGGLGTGIADEGEPTARVVCSDALRALPYLETVGIPPESKYDVATLRPPYEEIVYAELLEAVANSVLVNGGYGDFVGVSGRAWAFAACHWEGRWWGVSVRKE